MGGAQLEVGNESQEHGLSSLGGSCSPGEWAEGTLESREGTQRTTQERRIEKRPSGLVIKSCAWSL